MKRRWIGLLWLLGTGWAAAQERGPAVNLLVEVRWVVSAVSPAALGGARDGAVVVGTRGSVSPRGSVGVSTSAVSAQSIDSEQRLTVLNGQRARLQLSHTDTLQWVDTAIELEPGASAGPVPRRVYASPRQSERVSVQHWVVTPHWPGGQQPVRLEFATTGGTESQSTELQATVLLPLQTWQTVARIGESQRGSITGVTASTDATARTQRELQVRVSPAP